MDYGACLHIAKRAKRGVTRHAPTKGPSHDGRGLVGLTPGPFDRPRASGDNRIVDGGDAGRRHVVPGHRRLCACGEGQWLYS